MRLGHFGVLIAAAFAVSARDTAFAHNFVVNLAILSPSPGHGRDHYSTVQAQHSFAARQQGGNLRGRAPRFNKYVHF